MITYKEAQDKWVEKFNLEEGDEVLVLHAPNDHHWTTAEEFIEDKDYVKWNYHDMGHLVGASWKISVFRERGICIDDGYFTWTVPYFVLEPSRKALTYQDYITAFGDWVDENGIKVGTRVKISRTWEKGELGYKHGCGYLQKGHYNNDAIGTVKNIYEDRVSIQWSDNGDSGTYYPYFALEVIDKVIDDGPIQIRVEPVRLHTDAEIKINIRIRPSRIQLSTS